MSCSIAKENEFSRRKNLKQIPHDPTRFIPSALLTTPSPGSHHLPRSGPGAPQPIIPFIRLVQCPWLHLRLSFTSLTFSETTPLFVHCIPTCVTAMYSSPHFRSLSSNTLGQIYSISKTSGEATTSSRAGTGSLRMIQPTAASTTWAKMKQGANTWHMVCF